MCISLMIFSDITYICICIYICVLSENNFLKFNMKYETRFINDYIIIICHNAFINF